MQKDTRMRRSVSSYLRDMGDKNLSMIYISQVKGTLGRLAAFCEGQGILSIRQMDSETLRMFQATYSHWSGTYQMKCWSHVKGFLISTEHPLALKYRHTIRNTGRSKVDWLTPDQIEHVLTSPMTPTEAVLVCGGLLEGARSCELRSLSVGDARNALKTGYLRLVGKRKERHVPLLRDMRYVLEQYLLTIDRPDSARLLGFGPVWAWKLLQKVGKRVGLKFAGHTLRRSFARALMLKGVMLPKISKLLGHSNSAVTELYLGVNMGDMMEAMEVLESPRIRTVLKLPAQ
jgi:integrase